MLIYLNGVCASDNMTSDIENIASDDASGIEIRDSEYYDEVNDQYVYGETEITKNYTIADFDCCSFIIQEDGICIQTGFAPQRLWRICSF